MACQASSHMWPRRAISSIIADVAATLPGVTSSHAATIAWKASPAPKATGSNVTLLCTDLVVTVTVSEMGGGFGVAPSGAPPLGEACGGVRQTVSWMSGAFFYGWQAVCVINQPPAPRVI